ncbi:putative ribonuclease H-like domain-containing protein [Tanacetum coccineum]|uniref:Ribonuclease H-like domain-containing protein n=1 Tax=Tanacetum coccineum TaxID=301880 RepID=A0ABQ5IIM0_9ASTR
MVHNIRTRKVEENLHIRFLEDKPIIAGDGPKWLFDIDVLTKSMNYVPVVAGTNSNDSVGTEESNARNVEPQPSNDAGKKDDEGGIDDQEKPEDYAQYVNTDRLSINTASTNFNTGSQNINTVSPTVTTVPLKATHDDFFSDETELDMSNITTTYLISSTPNTRIHKDHSLDHVIGDVQSSVQTMRMINEQGFISDVYEEKTHEDLHICLFACFLSQEEPKKIAIGTKWVYRNKKDERGIVIRNKARLVAQGYTQEEGIDYDEVFTLVARIEEIRLFLAYALFKDFVVYQMDVKSAFLYGKIEEEVYYVDEILKKFGFSTMKTASTPMETSKPLLKDAEVEDVDVHLYRSMIGSLMYLTASRPDIMFADSPFDLEAYTDSDYAGASLDRKSVTPPFLQYSSGS